MIYFNRANFRKVWASTEVYSMLMVTWHRARMREREWILDHRTPSWIRPSILRCSQSAGCVHRNFGISERTWKEKNNVTWQASRHSVLHMPFTCLLTVPYSARQFGPPPYLAAAVMVCVCVRACVRACACMRVCACVTMKKVPDEWQTRQAISAILQASSSKHSANKNTTRGRGPLH